MLDRQPAVPRFPLRRLGTAVAAGVLTLGVSAAALAAPATAAAAARANPNARVRVSQGIGAAALAGATPLQPTPPATAMTVSFVLKAINLSGLETAVAAGWHAGYLSVAQFAAQYGQPPATVGALRAYLRGFGISSSADADNLEVTATGTAAQFNQALQVSLMNYAVPAVAPMSPPPPAAGPAPRTEIVHGTQADPSLPADLASAVLSILGLSNYGPFVSQALPALRPAGSPPPGTGGGGIPAGELTPANFESLYGVTPLEDAGALGQSRTIGIVTLASLDPGVPETFWARYLHLNVVANKISLVNVDGGAGAVSLANGSAETTLDVEQSGAIAPQARVVVYQAPNTDYGFVDAFFTAVSQDAAGSLSTSWGESETAITAAVLAGQESQTYAQCFNEAFLEAAAQGEATFVAAGDSGAYDASGDIGTTNLSVDSPADSPYATAAGGTTLPGTQTYTYTPPPGSTGAAVTESVDIAAQRTWGWNYLWPLYAAFGAPSEATFALEAIGGSGGGYSAYFPTPSYQQGVPGVDTFSALAYLTPDQVSTVDGLSLPTSWAFTASPGITTGSATGRAMPDLATDADPQTGYALYDPQFGPGPQAVQQYGGTSFVAPQLAGVTAVIDSHLGARVGFWNPSIYAFATSPSSPFTPLDTTGATNNNLYYSGSPDAVFNPGSGLGYPGVAALAADFASVIPAEAASTTPSSPPGPSGPGGPPGHGGSTGPGGPPPTGGPGAASRPRP